MGCGPYEVAFLMASLNIPNVENFRTWYYRHIDCISRPIRTLTKELIQQAREEEEVRVTFFDLLKEENSKLTTSQLEDEFHKWKNGVRTDEIGLLVSYDMGWQKKSSGKRYDSLSGHGFLVGLLTNQIIGMKVYSKACSICDSTLPPPKPEHECPKNWEGSSGSMECNAALEMFMEIHEQYKGLVYFDNFLSDDDSTTRATL